MSYRYKCDACKFYTDLRSNYLRHCGTQKHAKNLKRQQQENSKTQRLEVENETLKNEKMRLELEFAKRETELTRDKYESILRERDKKETVHNQIINQVTQHIDNSQHINFLNIVLPDMISLSQFITNLQTTHQLRPDQTRELLEKHNINVKSYGRCLSDTLRDNCYQQLVSSQIGIPPSVKVLPLIKIDEENHKEKSEKEWETANNNERIDELIQTANDQVYNHHHSTITLNTDDMCEVREQIKTDNNIDQIKNLQQDMKKSLDTLQSAQSIPTHTPDIPVYNPKDPKRHIVDCGHNYFVMDDTNHVFETTPPHKYMGKYIHDENCPCHSVKGNRRKRKVECWYYLSEYNKQPNTISI